LSENVEKNAGVFVYERADFDITRVATAPVGQVYAIPVAAPAQHMLKMKSV